MFSQFPMKGFNRFGALILGLLALLVPSFALAAGGENVTLEFSQQDQTYLFISIAFGVIALIFGFIIAKGVLAQSPGTEKMVEVSKAIEDGARAYLRQQIRTMSIFVVLIGVGLYFLYLPQYAAQTAIGVAISFVLGVVASYVAGYAGMIMAVKGNCRTANAALTSYKGALETAFRSGAVAGLVTVGMGLLGAAFIILLAGKDAMKLLVGFGFGGSLAALFMRVGGGIFTKAADVGADLVGKVEAGIPEDDPRNPAVIADNVGDNVGDCAGMAADVFESYEVTLVAAIVLGAATAAIFDTSTWMKLVLFALMARGIGILASIFGVYMVKGSEDINVDPLKSIKRGFTSSAVLAGVLTAGLAFYLMGGMPDRNPLIQTKSFVGTQDVGFARAKAYVVVATKIAKADKVAFNNVDVKKVAADPRFKATFAPDATAEELEAAANQYKQGITDPSVLPSTVKPLSGLKQVVWTDPAFETVANWTVVIPPAAGQQEPQFKATKDELAQPHIVAKVKVASQPLQGGTPPTQTLFVGPAREEELKKQFEQLNAGGTNVTIEESFPVTFYTDARNQLFAAVENKSGTFRLDQLTPNLGLTVFAKKPSEVNAQTAMMERPVEVQTVVVERKVVPWWKFALCIAIGIIMAFFFEILTDYYVSFKKRPVQEVALVSSAGPAPMIISGFAYGQESSVFSLFSIVFCLIAPLLIFNPAEYGGYLLSFYGIALVGLGLLTTTGFILAMDTFGPISDNAQGVFEMSGAGEENPEGARRVQLLDAAGNTTKALTKGFAIATAVVAAVALFHAYVDSAKLVDVGMRLEVPEIFLGLLIGGAAPYLFSAFSINAVGRAAFQLINEVRDQFRNDPGIMAGTSKPNYGRCVAIVTAAAQKELLGPGILAIALPALVAFGLSIGKELTIVNGVEYNLVGAQALGGFLAGTILSGQLLAVLLANSGGMWDNSKKLIEDGLYGGKGTEQHKAAVVCDTVGDPFKDTAGPALNPLIKVMNLIALLIVPVVIQPRDNQVLAIVTLVCLAALGYAIYSSKKGGLGSEMAAATGGEEAKAEA